jgi:hypothetical protein
MGWSLRRDTDSPSFVPGPIQSRGTATRRHLQVSWLLMTNLINTEPARKQGRKQPACKHGVATGASHGPSRWALYFRPRLLRGTLLAAPVTAPLEPVKRFPPTPWARLRV